MNIDDFPTGKEFDGLVIATRIKFVCTLHFLSD